MVSVVTKHKVQGNWKISCPAFDLLSSLHPYFGVPAGVVYGKDFHEVLVFIDGEVDQEGEFFNQHAAHIGIADGIAQWVFL
jgi:hypothetical protein